MLKEWANVWAWKNSTHTHNSSFIYHIYYIFKWACIIAGFLAILGNVQVLLNHFKNKCKNSFAHKEENRTEINEFVRYVYLLIEREEWSKNELLLFTYRCDHIRVPHNKSWHLHTPENVNKQITSNGDEDWAESREQRVTQRVTSPFFAIIIDYNQWIIMENKYKQQSLDPLAVFNIKNFCKISVFCEIIF